MTVGGVNIIDRKFIDNVLRDDHKIWCLSTFGFSTSSSSSTSSSPSSSSFADFSPASFSPLENKVKLKVEGMEDDKENRNDEGEDNDDEEGDDPPLYSLGDTAPLLHGRGRLLAPSPEDL
jgi:hypothetical protein